MQPGGAAKQKEIYAEESPMLLYPGFVTAVEEADGKEEKSPYFTHPSVGDIAQFETEPYAKGGESQCPYTDDEGGFLRGETQLAVEEFEKDEEKYACHEQSSEKPECPGHEFVISAHGCEYQHEPMHEIAKGIGMGYSAAPVAILFVEDSEVEKHVVEQEEKQTPFYERDVEPFEAFFAERPRVGGIFGVEEISCGDKEERHVERIDEISQEFGSFRMTCHHKDYSYPFGD